MCGNNYYRSHTILGEPVFSSLVSPFLILLCVIALGVRLWAIIRLGQSFSYMTINYSQLMATGLIHQNEVFFIYHEGHED